jgi:hypothetical protein
LMLNAPIPLAGSVVSAKNTGKFVNKTSDSF